MFPAKSRSYYMYSVCQRGELGAVSACSSFLAMLYPLSSISSVLLLLNLMLMRRLVSARSRTHYPQLLIRAQGCRFPDAWIQ